MIWDGFNPLHSIILLEKKNNFSNRIWGNVQIILLFKVVILSCGCKPGFFNEARRVLFSLHDLVPLQLESESSPNSSRNALRLAVFRDADPRDEAAVFIGEKRTGMSKTSSLVVGVLAFWRSTCLPGFEGRRSRDGVTISANWLPRGEVTSLVRRLTSSGGWLAFCEVSRRVSGGGGTRSGTQLLSESGLIIVTSRIFRPISLDNGDGALESGGMASRT